MGRFYTVEITDGSILAADTDIDYFELTPADDKPIKLWGIFMHQDSDLGDANEEVLRWQVIRGHTVTGSGGTSPTPRPLNRSDAAAGFTAETLNETIATTGTTHVLHSSGWNIRVGLDFWWPPETMPEASQADTTLIVRQLSTADDDITGVQGTLYVEELG